ncbi:hypothetical protein [Bradyrhizobium sp. 33ap4]|uniref:hypothetical protein n=1 Tax=Bradyrhizobium sp. 33ap4 TaxID=3061630 RepID=UPI00293064F6|nr:hypothetical protein [Bradyrhizobium sp. 33ap4]
MNNVAYFNRPVTERFSYSTRKMYPLPKLTDLQLAALAAVRDGDVQRYEKRVGYDRFEAFRTHGFDVTCQMQSLKKRRCIRMKSDGSRTPQLTPAGVAVLAEHPEY